MNKTDDDPSRSPHLSGYALAETFTAEIVGFALLGLWIDWQWRTTPWALILLGMSGMALAIVHLVRGVNRSNR